MKGRSRSSTSLVISLALSASVRATSTVGTSHHVGCEARRGKRADEVAGGHKHLAAEMAALLFAGQLVLEVDASRAGFDHALHQLEGVERSTEAGLGVGHDRREPMCGLIALGVLDLVGALQGLVDAFDQQGHAVDRVEALVRVHLSREVGVGRAHCQPLT